MICVRLLQEIPFQIVLVVWLRSDLTKWRSTNLFTHYMINIEFSNLECSKKCTDWPISHTLDKDHDATIYEWRDLMTGNKKPRTSKLTHREIIFLRKTLMVKVTMLCHTKQTCAMLEPLKRPRLFSNTSWQSKLID